MIPAADPRISDRGMGKQQNTTGLQSHLRLLQPPNLRSVPVSNKRPPNTSYVK